MRKGEFYSIEDNKINKLNLLLIGFGVIAVCITGFCYTAYLQNKSGRDVRYVNRVAPYEENTSN